MLAAPLFAVPVVVAVALALVDPFVPVLVVAALPLDTDELAVLDAAVPADVVTETEDAVAVPEVATLVALPVVAPLDKLAEEILATMFLESMTNCGV